MHKITDDQIDFILDDIQANGVTIEDLQLNLLDHICCIIENEMSEKEDFYKFYEDVVSRFFKKELKEIQEETEDLLIFKDYYAMKNTLKISGIASACLTLVGAVFKIMHWPGAGIMIVLGIVAFSLVFLPLMIALKFKDNESKTDKVVFTIGLLLGIMASMGVLFKLMHWPFANVMMLSGISGFTFGYVPLYFVTRVRRADVRFNTTVNAVLMMACGGMLFALMNIGHGMSFDEQITASHDFVQDNSQKLLASNDKMLKEVSINPEVNQFHEVSMALYVQLEEIKLNLISNIQGVSKSDAAKLTLKDLKTLDANGLVNTYFGSNSGELGLQSLKKSVSEYNSLVVEVFPGQEEKVIAIELLPLEKSSLGALLQELTAMQWQITSSENSFLYAAVKTKGQG